jgi:glutamyl-tRNA reductase
LAGESTGCRRHGLSRFGASMAAKWVAALSIVAFSLLLSAFWGIRSISDRNRTEFYIVTQDSQLALEPLFHGFYGQVEVNEFQHLFRLKAVHSIRRLFRVASGLESMVLGETEIFGQVKRAYEAAARFGTTGRILNRLFQKAFHMGKHIRSATAITRGSVSVGSVAVDLARQIFGKLEGQKIMILGAGETSKQLGVYSRMEPGNCLSRIVLRTSDGTGPSHWRSRHSF